MDVVGDLVEGRRGSGQLVGPEVEELGHGREGALVDAFFAMVAGDFFDPEHIKAEVDCAVDAGPKVSLFPFSRWMVTLE